MEALQYSIIKFHYKISEQQSQHYEKHNGRARSAL